MHNCFLGLVPLPLPYHPSVKDQAQGIDARRGIHCTTGSHPPTMVFLRGEAGFPFMRIYTYFSVLMVLSQRFAKTSKSSHLQYLRSLVLENCEPLGRVGEIFLDVGLTAVSAGASYSVLKIVLLFNAGISCEKCAACTKCRESGWDCAERTARPNG